MICQDYEFLCSPKSYGSDTLDVCNLLFQCELYVCTYVYVKSHVVLNAKLLQ